MSSNLVFHGSESISFFGAKIWDILPFKLIEFLSVDAFKKSIKEWKPKNCSCRLQKKIIKFWVHLQLLRETFLRFFVAVVVLTIYDI